MKPLRVVAINMVVLLSLALAAELVFGQWIAASPLGRLAVPRNVNIIISAGPLYAGGGEFVYRRDAIGFRGSGVDPRRISILTIGGSTTNQLYLPEEATWQAVLERSLHQSGHDVVVANSRGPATLVDLAKETGAKPVSVAEVPRGRDLVVVTIPEGKIPDLPRGLFKKPRANLIVIDTGNYRQNGHSRYRTLLHHFLYHWYCRILYWFLHFISFRSSDRPHRHSHPLHNTRITIYWENFSSIEKIG